MKHYGIKKDGSMEDGVLQIITDKELHTPGFISFDIVNFAGFANITINISGNNSTQHQITPLIYYSICGLDKVVDQFLARTDKNLFFNHPNSNIAVIVDALCATAVRVDSYGVSFNNMQIEHLTLFDDPEMPVIPTNNTNCYQALCNILKKYPDLIAPTIESFIANCKNYPKKDRCKLAFLEFAKMLKDQIDIDVLKKSINSGNTEQHKKIDTEHRSKILGSIASGHSTAMQYAATSDNVGFESIRNSWKNKNLQEIRSIINGCGLSTKLYKDISGNQYSLLEFIIGKLEVTEKTEGLFFEMINDILPKYDIETRSNYLTSSGTAGGEEKYDEQLITAFLYERYVHAQGNTFQVKILNKLAKIVMRESIRKGYELDRCFNEDIDKMIDKLFEGTGNIFGIIEQSANFDLIIKTSIDFFNQYDKLTKDGNPINNLEKTTKDLKEAKLKVDHFDKFIGNPNLEQYKGEDLWANSNLSEVRSAYISRFFQWLVIGVTTSIFKNMVEFKAGTGAMNQMSGIMKALILGSGIALSIYIKTQTNDKYRKAHEAAKKRICSRGWPQIQKSQYFFLKNQKDCHSREGGNLCCQPGFI